MSAARTIRVMTWNIHGGIGPDGHRDLARIVRVIEAHKPDVLALQEIDSRGHPKNEPSPLAYLTAALGVHQAEARTIVAEDGHYGHAVISRWPMTHVKLHDLSYWKFEKRCAIECDIETPFGPVNLSAVHLGLWFSERRRQATQLVDLYLKQFEAQREAEIRHKLQEENFKVRAEKISAEQALRRSQEHQEAMTAAEAQQRILIEELSHRVKNMLAVVNAMARQTLASTPEPEAFVEKFLKRIEALGRTHGLLSREHWGNVQLRDVASEALEPYIMEDKARVVIDGPAVAIQPKAAVALGIVFHELATNAVKHGSLSNNDGVVTVQWDWCRDEGGAVALEWGESKGPRVKTPTRNGFGSRLIKLELTHELSGNVEMAYDEGGFRALMTFPTSARIIAADAHPPEAATA